MNENNNNNNNNNNYVMPEKVDLSKVNVNQNNNNMLNRERDNIVSATIQANQAINQNQASSVNNAIKVQKRNPIVNFLIVLVLFIGAGYLAYLGYRLTSKYIEADDAKHSTTSSTTTKANPFPTYVYKRDIARKFQNDTMTLILVPVTHDFSYRYILFTKNDEGIINKEEGTYDLKNNTLGLNSTDGNYRLFIVDDHNLSCDGVALEMYDSEMKYYKYQDDNSTIILLLNGAIKYELAYYYNNGVFSLYNYTEDASSITLENGEVFTKSGFTVINNGYTLEMGN